MFQNDTEEKTLWESELRLFNIYSAFEQLA